MALVRITLGASQGDLYSGNKETVLDVSVFETSLGFDGIGEVKSMHLVTDAGFGGNTSLSTFEINSSISATLGCLNKSNSSFFSFAGSTQVIMTSSWV